MFKSRVKKGYRQVDGHQLFTYEYSKRGEATLLLHGGLSSTESWDWSVLPALKNRHVFAYDRSAHGRTGSRDGYYHFEFQTKEAISHAQAASLPMIFAINKIDKSDANPDRVRTELLQYEVQVESLGGDVIEVEVSATKRMNLDRLLEMIALQAEVLDLKANPDRAAEGTVIEARLDRGRGPVATVLVQRGTLKVGDYYICGSVFGRVRAMPRNGKTTKPLTITQSDDIGPMMSTSDGETPISSSASRSAAATGSTSCGSMRPSASACGSSSSNSSASISSSS